jgi:hypothetical protein
MGVKNRREVFKNANKGGRMKRFLYIGLMTGIASFLAFISVQALDAAQTINNIKADMQNRGTATADLNIVEPDMRDMLDRGATQADIERPISDLTDAGVRGEDFRRSVRAMDDMIKSGRTPQDASSAISQTVRQARAEGLTGKSVADRILGQKPTTSGLEQGKEMRMMGTSLPSHDVDGGAQQLYPSQGMGNVQNMENVPAR